MKCLFALSLGAWVIGMPTATFAATYYISTTGSDANPGTQAQPWLTLSHAVAAAGSSSTINVAAGDYSGQPLIHFTTPGQTFIGANRASLLRQISIEAPNVILQSFNIGTNFGGGWSADPICHAGTNVAGSTLDSCYIFSFVGRNQVGLNIEGSLFTCSNCEFTKFTAAQVVQFSGSSNQFVNCFIHDCPSAEAAFYIWGYYNRIAGCTVSNVNEAELSGAHPDLFQSFFAPSWGHLIESNLFVNNSCQIGSLQSADANVNPYRNDPNAGGWVFRNNVFINSGSKLDVDFRDMQFVNNTFYNCSDNTAEGHVINFNYSGYGIGTNGVMINNLFVVCGADPASTGQGWFGIDEGTNTQNIVRRSMTISNNFVAGARFAAKDTNILFGSKWINGGNPKFLYAPSSRIHKLNLLGTTTANNTTNLVGVGTSFTTELAVGDWITLGPYWTNAPAQVMAILSPTNLWVDRRIGTGTSLKDGLPQRIQRSRDYDPMPDLRLLSGSLAIDAGANLAFVPNDFAGNPRPLGARADIGAYEGATPEVVPTNMILHITFNNWTPGTPAPDSTANHCDAMLFGGSGNWPVPTNGPDGGAAAHIGDSQYFGIMNVAALQNLTQGTVAVWAKRDSPSFVYGYILDCGFTYPSTNGWTLGNDTGNPTKLYVYDSTFNRQTILTFDDYQNTAWHHYAFTWSGTICVGYLDGQPFQTNTLPSSVLTLDPANWLAIGTMQHNGTPQWGDDPYPNAAWLMGSVTDVRMYNTALSASDILNIYYVAASPQLPSTAPPPSGGSLPPQMLMHLTFANWNGKSNVLDQTTNRVNAVAYTTNGPTLTVGPFGTNAAAHFANKQWLAVTNTAVFEYLTNGTISLWINYDNAVDSGDYYALDGFYSYPDVNCFMLGAPFGNSSQFTQFLTSNSRVVSPYNDWTFRGTWHHYAITWNGLVVTLYLDGQWQATVPQASPFLHVERTARWLALGVQHGSHTWTSPTFGWLRGSLADVRIYNYSMTRTDIGYLASFLEPSPPPVGPRPTTPSGIKAEISP